MPCPMEEAKASTCDPPATRIVGKEASDGGRTKWTEFGKTIGCDYHMRLMHKKMRSK